MLGAGILGLLAMSTAQRTREIGIRIALGATTGRVAGMMAAEQLSAVALGLIAGALASLWVVRLLEAQLYGVGPYDPAVWAAVSLLILAVAALGTLVPSLRASRVDPVHALKHDP